MQLYMKDPNVNWTTAEEFALGAMTSVLVLTLLLLTTALVGTAASDKSAMERRLVIDSAIREAKQFAKMQADLELDGLGSSLHAFKLPSRKSLREGKARVLLENIVRHAERKLLQSELLDIHRNDAGRKAEILAKELFHTPGSLLTQEELVRVHQESGCPPADNHLDCSLENNRIYRTPSGECNNFNFPLFGAADRPYRRLFPSQYEDGVGQLRGTMQSEDTTFFKGPFDPPNPSARFVSNAIVKDQQGSEQEYSHFLMQWGQFIDHDVDETPAFESCPSSCDIDADTCVPILVKSDDPSFQQGCIAFPRSIAACGNASAGKLVPREQLNEITSFVDGSQVYGSKQTLMDRLREVDGSGQASAFLRTGENIPASGGPSLPRATQSDIDNRFVGCPGGESSGCFLAGDIRANEQTGLTVMHTIWMREHNRVAKELQSANPHWDPDIVFRVARQIVGAEIQKITYKDYLPKILGEQMFNELIGDYDGYDLNVDPTIPNAFAAAAFRFGHSQVQASFERLDENYDPLPNGPLLLKSAFFNPIEFTDSDGTDPILRGMATTPSRKMNEFLNSVLTTQLFDDNSDLAALNIQRGRDHGLAPYLVWKRWAARSDVCGISSDIRDSLTFTRLLQTYGSMETVDLWLGGLAESRLPGALVGATLACIFSKTFHPLRNADRFYYENVKDDANPDAFFTAAQRDEIEKASLSRVICDNADNIGEIQADAFRIDSNRVSCSTIPKMDLTVWKEEETARAECAVQVRIKGRSKAIKVLSVSRLQGQTSPGDTVTTVNRQPNQEFVCLPFVCPTKETRSTVTISTPNDQCVLDSYNRNMPGNGDSSSAHNMYTGSFTVYHITPYTGAYSSLTGCKDGGVGGLYYSCNGQSNQIMVDENPSSEKKELIGLLQDFVHKLENDEKTEGLETSDRALLSELEDALKELP